MERGPATGESMILRARHASVSAALIVGGLLMAVATAGFAGVAPVHAGPVTDPAPVLDAEQTASQQARVTGQPVEVTSLLTETTRVVANPDGTFTAEVHAGPTRYRDESGAWHD